MMKTRGISMDNYTATRIRRAVDRYNNANPNARMSLSSYVRQAAIEKMERDGEPTAEAMEETD